MAEKYLKVRLEAEKLFNEGLSVVEVASRLNMTQPAVRYWKAQHDKVEVPEDVEQLELTITQQRKIQKLQDANRIERKGFRTHAREFNAAEELFQHIVEKLDYVNVIDISTEAKRGNRVGIFQLSDLHFGEVIDLPKNKFNLEVAKERIETYIRKSIALLKAQGITDVYFVLTGDMINSDRRPDESLTNACTNAESLVHTFNVISQALHSVSKEFNILEVISICGNESRITFDLSSIDKLLINNYDYLLHEMLRAALPNLKFSGFTSNNVLERVLDVEGCRILITHGMFNANKPDDAVKRAKLDFDCDYVMCGHVHSTMITSSFRRSSGLPASNSYSYHKLQILEHTSAQNIHWVEDNKLITIEVVLN